MMIFTDCCSSDSDLGSSEDDSALTGDEDDESDIEYTESVSEDGGDVDEEVGKNSQEGDSIEITEDIAEQWRRGRLSSSTLGEWSRLYTGLQKWHIALSEQRRQSVGPLSKPYRR